VAETLYETTVVGTPPEVVTAMFAGQAIVGRTVSRAVTENEQALVLLAKSVVWHCTTAVDSRRREKGLVTLHVGGSRMPDESEAVGVGNPT
jgi:hypothetical protein